MNLTRFGKSVPLFLRHGHTSRMLRPAIQSVYLSSRVEQQKKKEVDDTAKALEKSSDGPSALKLAHEEERPLKIAFTKGLFTGKFDTDVLTYPEILNKEDHATLHDMVRVVEKFFEEEVDSKAIDVNAKIPEKVLDGLKSLGLFGQQIPTDLGGLGLNATGYARIAEAVSDGSIAVTLAAHQAIGLKGLLLYGTDEQKKKYLPRLASGETVAAFCLTEPGTGSDAASVKTTATLSPDGKHWILNGSKLWISNGGIADFFTVFASTSNDVTVGSSKRMTAFVVERNFGGVTNGKPEDKLGIRGSNTCEVHFENTPVPTENIIGGIGNGFKVAVNILNSGRFSMGSAGAGMLRKLIQLTVNHAIERKQFGKPLSDFNLIKEKVTRVALHAYVMESMAYLTAGMLDSGEYEDCALEAAIVKIYSSEACWTSASECLQILGGMGYMKDYPFERLLRDSRILLIFEGTNEILRLFVALSGIEVAGKELREMVKKLRNPFQFPTLTFKKMYERWRRQGVVKPTLHLNEFLHPSLQDASNCLDFSVLKLHYIIEVLLLRHGAKIVDAQQDLQRVADIVIDIYATTAVLSRASRSYCTGIRNAADEMMMADLIAKRSWFRIEQIVKDLDIGQHANLDKEYIDIANRIIESKGYPIQHPLTRNIW